MIPTIATQRTHGEAVHVEVTARETSDQGGERWAPLLSVSTSLPYSP